MAIISLKSNLRGILSRLTGRGGGRDQACVEPFSDRQQLEAAFDSRIRGIRAVRLDRIVGSVGRYQDFDSHFRLKNHLPSQRLESIKAAMCQGHSLPPVQLCQIKDKYYVEDGNHRIAAAKALGHDEILAHIVEFIPSGNRLEDLLYRQRAEFYDQTQLAADITLTEVGQYAHLLNQIAKHQGHLQSAGTTPVSFVDAAQDWHRFIYRPLCNIIKRGGLPERFPKRTLGDLYTYISLHLWEKGERRHYGIGIHKLIPKTMEEFRQSMADYGEADYPEMQRKITAFVLMTVQARREPRIVQKLFELDEVQEIHTVHGDVDLLVKIHLTRDLLSSDSEIISDFVQRKVRKLQGVNSTKTLIPGFSRIKTPV